MWAAEKGGGNAAHTETLPQKRLPAQAGNVIQLRCKPTSRQFSVRPSARKSPAGAGLVAGHACRLAGPRRTHGARQARHTKTPCPQRGQDSVANGWAAGDGRRIERYADCMVARITEREGYLVSIGPSSRHCPLLRFGRGMAQGDGGCVICSWPIGPTYSSSWGHPRCCSSSFLDETKRAIPKGAARRSSERKHAHEGSVARGRRCVSIWTATI
jgi:hypothetical protein